MKVGEDDLAAAQQRILGRQRLFDLEDQIGAAKYLGRRIDELGSLVGILLVGNARAESGTAFEQDRMSRADEFLHADGQHGHAVFVAFDLLGNADNQVFAPRESSMRRVIKSQVHPPHRGRLQRSRPRRHQHFNRCGIQLATAKQPATQPGDASSVSMSGDSVCAARSKASDAAGSNSALATSRCSLVSRRRR